MKKRKTPDLEKYLEGKKRRFVNYTQGAKIYRMSYWPFVRLAKKAEANYPIRKTAIVDLNREYPKVCVNLQTDVR